MSWLRLKRPESIFSDLSRFLMLFMLMWPISFRKGKFFLCGLDSYFYLLCECSLSTSLCRIGHDIHIILRFYLNTVLPVRLSGCQPGIQHKVLLTKEYICFLLRVLFWFVCNSVCLNVFKWPHLFEVSPLKCNLPNV